MTSKFGRSSVWQGEKQPGEQSNVENRGSQERQLHGIK